MSKDKPGAGRNARLASALRDNLRRRKAAAKPQPKPGAGGAAESPGSDADPRTTGG